MKRKGIGRVFKAKRLACGEGQRCRSVAGDKLQLQESVEKSSIKLLRSLHSPDTNFSFPSRPQNVFVFKSCLY